jgi:hypothetical protein
MSAWSWVKGIFSYADGETTQEPDGIDDVMQYCILSSATIAGLETLVNEKAATGFLPSGSVGQGFQLNGNSQATLVYTQAMLYSGNPIV